MPCSRAMPETRILVEVPAREHVPPRMVAKERGMRSLDGLEPDSRQNPMMTGSKMATRGVLLTKAERNMQPTRMSKRARRSLPPASLLKTPPRRSIWPVLSSAAVRMKRAPIVTGAGLAKHFRTSGGVRMPVSRRIPAAEREMSSTDKRSFQNKRKVPKRRKKTSG